MNKILCTLILLILSCVTPFSLSAAPDIVIRYANTSTRGRQCSVMVSGNRFPILPELAKINIPFVRND
jgi:hypothetical protein